MRRFRVFWVFLTIPWRMTICSSRMKKKTRPSERSKGASGRWLEIDQQATEAGVQSGKGIEDGSFS